MKTKVNYAQQKIVLVIYNFKKEIIEEQIFWDFDILKEKLYRKLKYLAVIKANKKFFNGKKYFYYYEMNIYKLKNFKTFINLINSGAIRISFKIGVFHNGSKIGKIHDRGTSFSIQEKDLKHLYDVIDIFN